MTSNPQSRRPDPIEVTSDPTITPWLLRQMDDKIRQHELRIALYSSLLGIPTLLYILTQLHYIKSQLPV